uniref:tRNA-dihydrouridine(47) synthase [NAD(P)(+)]-like isoform X1 n=1 Tax=Ictidomys tridecemlineatus TaxID=43179 RepID=UPI001A9FD08E|nr:tRNA-dihydrouridine(47) synthase [NAD(P)(+)]-like isoform X1 [Ictidomys tridecemlineatus]
MEHMRDPEGLSATFHNGLELSMAEGAKKAPAESGGDSDSAVSASERGVAPIKSQYLTTKEQFHHFLEAKGEKLQQESEAGDPDGNDLAEPRAKRIRLEDGQAEDGQAEQTAEPGQQPQAQKRARGQNKGRPHVKPTHYDKTRLCPSLIQSQTESLSPGEVAAVPEVTNKTGIWDAQAAFLVLSRPPSAPQESAAKCVFGDRCRFLHDVSRYLETKPADLGPRCVLFETFGRCPYGVTCRFAGAHLGPEGQNLVQEELASDWAHRQPVRNGLDKALQQQLRKRKIRFERAELALRQLSQGQLPGPSAGAVLEATTAEGTPGQSDCGAQQAPAGPDAGCSPSRPVQTCGPLTDEDVVRLRPCEKKRLDISGKLYLAPLTTCGNLPFRRICKRFGADVTCGEMAVCTNLLQGQMSEWALLKRHQCEDIFGVQLEGAFPDTMTRCAELLGRTIEVDFVDINVGCPIDLVYKKGGGCALMNRTAKFQQIVRGMSQVLDVPLTVKLRTGVQERVQLAHRLLPELRDWGAALITLHGRSREQRYTKLADWEYIAQCAKAASPMPLFGNGDILSYEDANRALKTGVAGVMIARGALLKPWLFTEIKEQRHWDISSSERLDILRDFTSYGLEHWGSDTQGVEKTRRFLLEWLSFLCRYVPVGLLERLPQRVNERPPYYLGRDYLETLMASQQAADWIRISEMLLGPVPPGFVFLPKHKANAYK